MALAAISIGGTVKWVEDRRENFLAAPQARGVRLTLELGTDGSGHFLAMRQESLEMLAHVTPSTAPAGSLVHTSLPVPCLELTKCPIIPTV